MSVDSDGFMKNPNEPIGNGNLDLPACSAVPQATTPWSRSRVKYCGPSVIRIPGWSGQFWANYSPAFPIKITVSAHNNNNNNNNNNKEVDKILKYTDLQ